MCLTTTNTLAYNDTVKNTAEKSFIVEAPKELYTGQHISD
jgi:hypothetical protein